MMRNKPFETPGLASFFGNLRKARLVSQLHRGELALVLLAGVCGVAAGLLVALVGDLSRLLHYAVFGVDGSLSGSAISGPIVVAGPVIGGCLMGLIAWLLTRYRRRPMRDPIEANALHGGRLSLTDSIIVTMQNVVSNGFGASVGLEAGYTQISSGVSSRLGAALKLRRGDMRILVGCGAAGAIAAAFDAPLTAAFYAIELIIGSYTAMTLAPVITSALVAKLVIEQIAPRGLTITMGEVGTIGYFEYLPAVLFGIVCAIIGIIVMQSVSFIEELWRKSPIPPTLRPVIGGGLIGLLALISPQILAGGHGALHINLDTTPDMSVLFGLFVLKALASAVSIGSGFRGGLFFASLFMGALLGKLFAAISMALIPGVMLSTVVFAVVGMSAFAAAIIGGPLTMTFLALELTGSFPITTLVLAASITTTVVVRLFFGYSFATWRFHLRGEAIRSAHDIGWIRDLNVRQMMRADVRVAPVDTGLDAFRRAHPLGSTQRVVMVDRGGRYAGLIFPPDVYAATEDGSDSSQSLGRFLRHSEDMLLPQMNIQEAAAKFETSRSEALVVINDLSERRPIGLLTESHALRRYSEELDLRRREASGEI